MNDEQKTAKPVHLSMTDITSVYQFYFSSVADPHRRRLRGDNTTAYFKGEATEIAEKDTVSTV